MSSADDTFAGDGGPSTAGSPYDEPTQAIPRPRSRRPKPDNDDFFDRHGRRPAPAVTEVIDEKAVREQDPEPSAHDDPAPNGLVDAPASAVVAEPSVTADDAPTEALPVTDPPGEASKTAVIVSAGAAEPAQSPIKKSMSSEPVHTEPFADVDEDTADDDPDGRRRFAEHLTEPPLPYIEPQPTTPLAVDDMAVEEPQDAALPDTAPDAELERPAPAAPVRRGTLDLGLLILRLVVGATFAVHGLQKLTGWLNGPGPGGFADFLANKPNPGIGFHSNVTTVLSLVAGVSETAGGILLVLGLLTPIAGAAVLSTIIVATTYKVTLAGGLWFFAADGGGNGIELEVLLAAAALALILTGPGTYSFDRRWGWSRRPAWGSAAWVIIAIGAAVAVWIVFNGTNPLTSPGNPAG